MCNSVVFSIFRKLCNYVPVCLWPLSLTFSRVIYVAACISIVVWVFFSSVFSCKTNVKHCFRFRPRCCSICSLSLYLCQIFDYHTMSLTMTLHTRASARALTTVLRNECLEVHPNASWLGVTSGATSPRCQCLIPSS